MTQTTGGLPARRRTQLEKLASNAFSLAFEDPRAALGFSTRLFLIGTLPYRALDSHEFTRENGAFRLHVHAPPEVGLPYGRYPRLLMAWICTQAIRTQERVLDLGDVTGFMTQVGVTPTGGKTGTMRRFQEQMERLLSTDFRLLEVVGSKEERLRFRTRPFALGDADLWWNAPGRHEGQAELWQAQLVLSEPFFEELMAHPIPINLRALAALQAPLGLDLYVWITYRMISVTKPTLVPWAALHQQLGTQSPLKVFRFKAVEQLKRVLALYPEAKVEESSDRKGLLLRPSPTHVPRVSYLT